MTRNYLLTLALLGLAGLLAACPVPRGGGGDDDDATDTDEGCVEDEHEPNDDWATAELLNDAGAGPFHALFEARVCPGNDDLYTFTLDEGAEVFIPVEFAHADGDIDVELYESTFGELVDESASGDDHELILFTSPYYAQYTLRVFLWDQEDLDGNDYIVEPISQ